MYDVIFYSNIRGHEATVEFINELRQSVILQILLKGMVYDGHKLEEFS